MPRHARRSSTIAAEMRSASTKLSVSRSDGLEHLMRAADEGRMVTRWSAPYHLVTVEYQLVSEMVPRQIRLVPLCFYKAEQRDFPDIYGLYQGQGLRPAGPIGVCGRLVER